MPLRYRFLIAAILFLPFLIAVLFTQAVTVSLAKLGISGSTAVLVLLGSLLGGFINVPVWRRQIYVPNRFPRGLLWPWELAGPRAGWAWTDLPLPHRFFFYQPPVVREQIIAVNLGGAVIPLLVSCYLLPRAPLVPVFLATAGVALVCYHFARPLWPVGIVLPAFIPPVTAALLAILLAPDMAPPVAYIAGTVGTLVGADLLHLPDLRRADAQLLSIGGAGVHDGIFLAGLVAALLA